MRVVIERVGGLVEVQTQWSLDDLAAALDALDAKSEITQAVMDSMKKKGS